MKGQASDMQATVKSLYLALALTDHSDGKFTSFVDNHL